jgi:hypothetical protein
MTTLAPLPVARNISKAFYCTLYNDENHGVLLKVDHVIYFMADGGELTEYEPEMAPWLTLNGEVGLSECQALQDTMAGGAPRICTSRDLEVR